MNLHHLRTVIIDLFAGRDDRGASLVEYALLLALIAVVCFVAVGVLGETTNSGLESVAPGFHP